MGGNRKKKTFSTYSVVILSAVKGEGTSVMISIGAVVVKMSFVRGGGGVKKLVHNVLCGDVGCRQGRGAVRSMSWLFCRHGCVLFDVT